MSSYLTSQQVDALLRPIKPHRVQTLDGMSHLAAYDVKAHLNRIFGFARWSADVLDVTALFEEDTQTKGGKPAVTVGYRVTLRLTVCAPDGTVLATYTEAATGDALMPTFKRADAHDFALKTAESQALKRCAINLGDQYGLSLYNNGATEPLVGMTLVKPGQVEAPALHEPQVAPEPERRAGGTDPEADKIRDRAFESSDVSALTVTWAEAKAAHLLDCWTAWPATGEFVTLRDLLDSLLVQRKAAKPVAV